MSWLEALYRTYEANAEHAGVKDESSAVLIPPFHTSKNAQISVMVDMAGNFKKASLIDHREDQEKVIPCTEDSSARTSGLSPHPLFESLQYAAGDLAVCAKPYLDSVQDPKKRAKAEKALNEANELYLKQLGGWCASPEKNPLVCAAYSYLGKKTLVHDLVSAGIVPVDAAGNVCFLKPKAEKGKRGNPLFSLFQGDLSKAFVVFEVYRTDGTSVRLYEDFSVRKSWMDYSLRCSGKTSPVGFCQILGKTAPLAELHPQRIRNPADGGKLISGNDNANFTFRGRFETPLEACGISTEVTQKAHSALRWLLKKQGYSDGTQYIVAWAVDPDVSVPQPTGNTSELPSLEDADAVSHAPVGIGTAEAAAKALDRLIAGYHARLNPKHLCVIMLDSATPGTMAVKSWRELEGWNYLDNIENWHRNCAWLQNYSKDKVFYGAPSPRDIAFAAYGSTMKFDDPRLRSSVARLLPCILDGAPIPRDFVENVIRRASNPCAVDPWEFRKTLGIACSLYRYYKSKERTYTMALDTSLKSRDYLFGRLLAAADYLESSAQDAAGESRPTNALRIMPFFTERPASAWNTLYKDLNPYMERLRANKPGLFVNLEKLFEEIHTAFDPRDYVSDSPLSGEYILGYYCQKAAFFTKKAEAPVSAEKSQTTAQN